MIRFKTAMLAALLPGFAVAGAAPIDTTDTQGDAVHSYILLDRTGSMSTIWDEALSSVNAYARSVSEDEEAGPADTLATDVTLAVFDDHGGLKFDVLRRAVNADAWSPVTNDEASPRGMTPLFDAIGRMIAMAEADAPEKAVIVIMTDGHENASREITREGARAALDRARGHGWEVVFLGADFGQFDDADAVGVVAGKQMGLHQGTMAESMNRLAKQSRAYGKGEQGEIEFTDEDRAIAREDEVKDADR